jgi:hypothetical protein
MEWFWPAAVILAVATAVAWGIRGRTRSTDPSEEAYSGTSAPDPVLTELGRQHHGRLF